jgi:hypothetical protein
VIKNGLEQFITAKTKNFFKRFNISQDFLSKNPAEWNDDPQYRETKEMLKKLKVVNDTAERGVQLMETFNKKFTKDEEELQYVLQIVENYRKQFPNYKKETLVTVFN